MNIIVDGMGGDYAPQEIVKGCILALKNINSNIIITGNSELIRKCLNKNQEQKEIFMSRIKIRHTSQVVDANFSATTEIRTKKDSSMAVGINMLKNNEGKAFLSAGSTGSLVAGGILILGRVPSIKRPALAGFIPTKKGVTLLADMGAIVECDSTNLYQFANMTNDYIKALFNISNPSIALVNIGNEKAKGTPVIKEADKLLSSSNLNYKGFIESAFIFNGDIDIVICDGWTGNIILKTTEGVAKLFSETLTKEMMKNNLTKLKALLLKKEFKGIKKKFDVDEYGGAILLGVDGIILKPHGSSDSKAIENTIYQAEKLISNNLMEKIKKL